MMQVMPHWLATRKLPIHRLMLGRLYDGQDCSAAKALELIGERWSLLILRDAMFRGYTRFSQFQHSLGVAPNILAKRLDGFVANGIMKRSAAGEYVLTDMGLETKGVVVALTLWGDRWLREGPVAFVDRRSGQPVDLNFTAGASPVPPSDVAARRRD